jgi:hypothetical protein
MRRTDHILAFTTTLLRATEARFPQLLATTQNTYTLDTPRKPGVVSLGADEHDREETFTAWLNRLRAEGIQQVSVTYHPFDPRDDMPPHVAAAFAGAPDLLLHVTTARETHAYAIETYFAPQHEITAAQFITLLDSQPNKSLVRARATTLILESNGMNNRSIFPPDETAAYLRSDEGRHVFDYLSSDLVKEIQIECTVHEQPFIIPAALQPLFVKYDNAFSFDNDDREYVYLYPLREVTARELLDLVKAQPFGIAVWEQLNKVLDEYNDPNINTTPEQWEAKFPQMPPEDLERIAHPLCRAICVLCENSHAKPIIPTALSEAFGPDEEEQKRTAARSKDKDRWMLQSTQNPWEYYAFQAIDYPQTEPPTSYAESKAAFTQALKEIQQFAASIQSPFEASFTMAYFILTQPAPASYDNQHAEKLAENMHHANISAAAIDNFRQASWIADLGTTLTWPATKIHSLLALKFADVFGGMGSWNDQVIETEQEKYHQVSSNLFTTLKQHLASTLSS